MMLLEQAKLVSWTFEPIAFQNINMIGCRGFLTQLCTTIDQCRSTFLLFNVTFGPWLDLQSRNTVAFLVLFAKNCFNQKLMNEIHLAQQQFCLVIHINLFGFIFLIDCKTVRIFAFSSTREQSNKRSGTRLKTESENGERGFCLSSHTPYGRVRLARFARLRLLRHALPNSLLILRKKTDCFAVYFSKKNFGGLSQQCLLKFFVQFVLKFRTAGDG